MLKKKGNKPQQSQLQHFFLLLMMITCSHHPLNLQNAHQPRQTHPNPSPKRVSADTKSTRTVTPGACTHTNSARSPKKRVPLPHDTVSSVNSPKNRVKTPQGECTPHGSTQVGSIDCQKKTLKKGRGARTGAKRTKKHTSHPQTCPGVKENHYPPRK